MDNKVNNPYQEVKENNLYNDLNMLQDILNDEKSVEEQVDLKFQIKKLYLKMKELLKDRERVILELRFGLHGKNPKTQNQIAKMMGISRSYVSRIETKAIGKLAKELKE